MGQVETGDKSNGCLAHLGSRYVSNTRVIIDVRANPHLVSGKLKTCNITPGMKMQIKVQSKAYSMMPINLKE